MKQTILLALILSLFSLTGFAQDFPTNEKEYLQKYAKNIKKSRINGVYIPKDIDEAFLELENLSESKAREKFKSGPEDLVAKRLIKGLGEWMIVNWNFYEGSRFSHHLRLQGVSHPNDMADFMIRIYHRSLNGKALDKDKLARSYGEKRRAARDAKYEGQGRVLEKRQRPRE